MIVNYLPHYLSTACYHGEHGECRLFCKWCRSGCLCSCHQDRTQ